MNENIIAKGILKSIFTLIGFGIIFFILWKISSLLVYILIAAIVSLIGRPIVILFNTKLKLPSSLSAGLVIFIFISIIGLLVYFFIPLLSNQIELLTKIDKTFIEEKLINKNLATLEYLTNIKADYIKENLTIRFETYLNKIDFKNIINYVLNTVSSISTALVCVTFISYFFLKDRLVFLNMILALVPTKHEKSTEFVIEKVNVLLGRYFLGLLLQVFVIFLIYLAILTFFTIKFSFTIALLCSVLNLIPYVGPLIGFFIFTGLSLNSLNSIDLDLDTILFKIFWLAITYNITQIIDNYILQPIIYSKSVKSHPLEIFIIIMIGGYLDGIIGIFIAVPFYTIFRVFLKEFFSEFKLVKSLTKDI
ncbi:MAG: AI-2E family transporter [Solirubrobacteraceae bacterium]